MFGMKKSMQGEEREISGLSWEADIVLNERRSRLIAWRIASVAVVLVVLMVISLMLLIPLKQVVPYVVTVDRLTGESSIQLGQGFRLQQHLERQALDQDLRDRA